MPKVAGSHLYGKGDPTPFKVLDPPDVVVRKLEDRVDEAEFVALRGEQVHEDTGETAQRTIYVRPRSVWAVTPFLEDDEP